MPNFLKKIIPFSTEVLNALNGMYANISHTHDERYVRNTDVATLQGGFPDWENVQENLLANTTYTQTSDGYYMIGVAGGNGTRLITTYINGRLYNWYGDSGSYKYGWGCMQVYLPVKKNISFSFNYNSSNQSIVFARFIPIN